MDRPVQNQFIADCLRETAKTLEQQGANRFRVAAYRKAAETVESLKKPVLTMLETEEFDGLTALPGIGLVNGRAMVEIVTTGQRSQLERYAALSIPRRSFDKFRAPVQSLRVALSTSRTSIPWKPWNVP